MSSKVVRWFSLLLSGLAFSVFADGSRLELGPDLALEPIAPGIWRHISSQEMEGWGAVEANGLVVVSDGEAALIDTPWTEDQTGRIVDWLEREQDAKLTIAVPTHWHGDCMGGLAVAHQRGAASYASEKTIAFAKEAGLVAPENGFTERLNLSVGSLVLSLEELGAGHTRDNIVVWLPQKKILFGGCLIKSARSKTMGYTKEADLDAWPKTLNRVEERLGDDVLIVPGHGSPGGQELLRRTRELITAFTRGDEGK